MKIETARGLKEALHALSETRDQLENAATDEQVTAAATAYQAARREFGPKIRRAQAEHNAEHPDRDLAGPEPDAPEES